MLGQLTLIFVCQFAGELIAGGLGLPVPGPVIGMVILFAFLVLRGGLPGPLGEVANGLHGAMALLFVPAGAGVVLHFRLLGESLLPISVALVISTVLTIAVTAWLMRALSRGEDGHD